MKPFYHLNELTIKRILGFIEKCEELELENVCFIYFPKLINEVKFYMVKHTDHWNLTVIQNWEKKSDIYKIKDESITFDYSKCDLS